MRISTANGTDIVMFEPDPLPGLFIDNPQPCWSFEFRIDPRKRLGDRRSRDGTLRCRAISSGDFNDRL